MPAPDPAERPPAAEAAAEARPAGVSPLRLVVAAAIAVLLLAVGWPLWQGARQLPQARPGGAEAALPVAADGPGLPWQIALLDDGGSRVFGIDLGRTPQAEAAERLRTELAWAVIAAPGEAGALEGFADNFQAGFVSGRLVLATEVDPARIARWRERLGRGEVYEGGSRRQPIAADATVAAEAASEPVVALSFVPAVNLAEATLVQRFGAPAERLPGADGEWQLLYPARGLAIALPAQGRPLLQYVAPRDFERRLRAPLLASAASAAAAATTPTPGGPVSAPAAPRP